MDALRLPRRRVDVWYCCCSGAGCDRAMDYQRTRGRRSFASPILVLTNETLGRKTPRQSYAWVAYSINVSARLSINSRTGSSSFACRSLVSERTRQSLVVKREVQPTVLLRPAIMGRATVPANLTSGIRNLLVREGIDTARWPDRTADFPAATRLCVQSRQRLVLLRSRSGLFACGACGSYATHLVSITTILLRTRTSVRSNPGTIG